MNGHYDFKLMTLLALVLIGCGRPPQIPKADLSEAFPEVAEFIAAKADEVAQKPRSAKAWGAYAMSLDAHEYRDIAIQAYQQAHQLDPREEKWSYLLSQQLRTVDAQAALQALQSITSPSNPELVAYRIGELAEEIGQLDLAVSSYHRVLEISPQHLQAAYRVAGVLFRAGDLDSATEQLDAIKQNYREPTKLRAQLSLSQGRVEEAKSLNAKAEGYPELLPMLPDPLMQSLAKYRRDPLYKAKQAVESVLQGHVWAITTLQNLVDDHPEIVQLRLLYADALLQQRDHKAADAVITKAVKMFPDNALLLALWGNSDLAQGRWAQAEEHFQKAIAAKPDYIGAHADLGYVLEQQGKIEEAIEQYELTLKMKPADEQIARRLERLKRHSR